MSPPFRTFDRKPLPPRGSLRFLLGPGLVWMALAQGSGELIWWPYVIARYGLAFLFLLIPACLLQFPLTFEIGRYTMTLFYSYWIKEKGAGMAAHMDRITGFRSGMTQIRSGQGALPADNAEAPHRLRRWYRYLAVESWIGILGNLATTLMTCLLAFALLHPKGLVPEKFQIAVVQSEFFAASWGDAGRLLFLFIAGAFLADTWLATVDCVSRIHLDALGSIWPGFAEKDQRPWYYGIVLALAVITSITMFFQQPGKLIITSAVIGFCGTVIYATALIVLNHVYLRRRLAVPLRSSRTSLVAITFVTACYFALAAAYLWIKLG